MIVTDLGSAMFQVFWIQVFFVTRELLRSEELSIVAVIHDAHRISVGKTA
jgi:hypothetical protein